MTVLVFYSRVSYLYCTYNLVCGVLGRTECLCDMDMITTGAQQGFWEFLIHIPFLFQVLDDPAEDNLHMGTNEVLQL